MFLKRAAAIIGMVAAGGLLAACSGPQLSEGDERACATMDSAVQEHHDVWYQAQRTRPDDEDAEQVSVQLKVASQNLPIAASDAAFEADSETLKDLLAQVAQSAEQALTLPSPEEREEADAKVWDLLFEVADICGPDYFN